MFLLNFVGDVVLGPVRDAARSHPQLDGCDRCLLQSVKVYSRLLKPVGRYTNSLDPWLHPLAKHALPVEAHPPCRVRYVPITRARHDSRTGGEGKGVSDRGFSHLWVARILVTNRQPAQGGDAFPGGG